MVVYPVAPFVKDVGFELAAITKAGVFMLHVT